MFFEEGWVPLSEATSAVFRQLQGLNAEGGIGEGQGSLRLILAITVWDICDAATKVGVTAADGTVIASSKDLVAWADPRELSNEHLNLMAGSVGSSTLRDADGNLPTEAELKARYGPFLHLPVVIPVNNFQSSLTFLAEEVKGNPTKDEEVVNGARTILKMVDSGEVVTREIARSKLGATMSRRKFKLSWALAAQHREDLAKPNRWAGL
ncbi:MAG: hypothetical protein QNJ44_06335 [Rhodobacter sp.]|nr:hypothetical protein [Rhodobacter sp.]